MTLGTSRRRLGSRVELYGCHYPADGAVGAWFVWLKTRPERGKQSEQLSQDNVHRGTILVLETGAVERKLIVGERHQIFRPVGCNRDPDSPQTFSGNLIEQVQLIPT